VYFIFTKKYLRKMANGSSFKSNCCDLDDTCWRCTYCITWQCYHCDVSFKINNFLLFKTIFRDIKLKYEFHYFMLYITLWHFIPNYVSTTTINITIHGAKLFSILNQAVRLFLVNYKPLILLLCFSSWFSFVYTKFGEDISIYVCTFVKT
jgi:hypothetical protein